MHSRTLALAALAIALASGFSGCASDPGAPPSPGGGPGPAPTTWVYPTEAAHGRVAVGFASATQQGAGGVLEFTLDVVLSTGPLAREERSSAAAGDTCFVTGAGRDVTVGFAIPQRYVVQAGGGSSGLQATATGAAATLTQLYPVGGATGVPIILGLATQFTVGNETAHLAVELGGMALKNPPALGGSAISCYTRLNQSTTGDVKTVGGVTAGQDLEFPFEIGGRGWFALVGSADVSYQLQVVGPGGTMWEAEREPGGTTDFCETGWDLGPGEYVVQVDELIGADDPSLHILAIDLGASEDLALGPSDPDQGPCEVSRLPM